MRLLQAATMIINEWVWTLVPSVACLDQIGVSKRSGVNRRAKLLTHQPSMLFSDSDHTGPAIMEAWAVIEDSAFGPQTIKVIGQAFDQAWEEIAGNYSDALREGARLQLASAILSIAKDGNLDVATLKKAGIDAMRSRELRS